MSSGAARLIVVVAFIGSSWLILANGYSGSTGGLAASAVTHQPRSPHAHSRSPRATLSPQVQGVSIAVFNGTTTANLAEQVQLKLANAGYNPAQPASNAPTQDITHTIVYYRVGSTATQTAQSRANALGLVHSFFPGAKILRLGSGQTGVDTSVQLAVFLGSDYKG
jgi:hypothetical protein